MKKINELIIAHRGESFDAPENTLAAINLAWKKGIRRVEIDVHLTKDNEIVVIHDFDTLRVSGEKMIIEESTLNDLKNLSAGLFKGEKWKNEKIPSFKEVLQTVPDDGQLIIEIKCKENILLKLQAELINSDLQNKQIVIIAFSLKTLIKARKLMPDYQMLWLLDLDYYWPWWLVVCRKRILIKKVIKHKLNGVNVWAGKILNTKFILSFKNKSLLVYCWTVNNPEKAKLLMNDGINGLTTDRASWMIDQFN